MADETHHNGEPILSFTDDAAWEAWLERNHATAEARIWIKHAKKTRRPPHPEPTVTHAQALQTALCFGWIDGQRNAISETHFLQRFVRRQASGRWSQINRDNAIRLTEQGRMRPAGLAQIEAAKQDGRWDQAYAPQSQATPPPDLQQALDAHPEAKAFFETLNRARRYAFIYRLTTIKRPDTRAKRIEQYVELLAAGKTLN
jgi:uncharacterized protein YdeI (YjbR/CyaY-like superfamily)